VIIFPLKGEIQRRTIIDATGVAFITETIGEKSEYSIFDLNDIIPKMIPRKLPRSSPERILKRVKETVFKKTSDFIISIRVEKVFGTVGKK
jgi:hypothetical protein